MACSAETALHTKTVGCLRYIGVACSGAQTNRIQLHVQHSHARLCTHHPNTKQVNHCEEWLQCLRATFDAMDADKDGRLKPSEILTALRDKLPEAEVSYL